MHPSKASLRVVLTDQALGMIGANASLTKRRVRLDESKNRKTNSKD